MTLSTSGYIQRCVVSLLHHLFKGLLQQGSPHWDNNWCKASPEETWEKAVQAKAVPIPEHDPISGIGGHLPKLWTRSIGMGDTA
jgi:hypothetical protein